MNLRDLIAKHENNNNGGNKDFPKVKWFNLRNDGDEMVVRFLHKGENDLEAYEVHEVEIDGYKTKVQCAGQGCPLCASLGNPRLRMFAQLVDAEGNHFIWERGITDLKNLMALIGEYGDLCDKTYKIKRCGQKGSTNTTYTYMLKGDCKTPVKDRVKVLGFYVKVLTNEQMIQALNGTLSLRKESKNGAPTNQAQAGPVNNFNTQADPFTALDNLEPIDDGDMPF